MANQTLTHPEPAGQAETSVETSPFVVEFYMIQGVGFRCMAYRDPRGKWRSAFNNDELYGEIFILE